VKKTSIYLDADLDERLARRAADEGLSKAEFIRRGLERLVNPVSRPRARGAGIIKGAPPDMAANDERYLAESGFGA
jgi:hypothetical protein